MKKSNKQHASPPNGKKKLKFQSQPKNVATKDKKMGKRKLLNSILIVFLSLVCIGGVCVFFMLVNIMKDAPDLDEAYHPSQSTPILYKDGTAMTTVGAENRENISYDQLPQTVIDAFLSIEDSRFFTHNGFDLPRFVSSAINNLRKGDLSQGGSTLTMQMVDNARKTVDENYDELNASSLQKIEWKIQEIFLSMDAERTLSKEEILVNYLNKVNFGYTARGIQKGAEYYFGKDVSELNLSESAFLAGVVNAPNMFNPYNGTQWSKYSQQWVNYYELATKRRDDTLYQMKNHGYINDEEYNLAKSTELAFQLNGEENFHPDSAYAVLDLVKKEAMEKYGININTTSCIVHTSIDPDAQALADQISNGEVVKFPNDDNFTLGFTMMSATTGEITAISAGRDFDLSATGLNAINQSIEPHQTGSAIKPIIAYAPGFDHLGYATSHTFNDEPMDIYGTGKVLGNSSGGYVGDVLFKDTVGLSYNTTAAKSFSDLIDKWGRDNIINYMKEIGLNSVNYSDFAIQYAIGGAGMTASTNELAGAFTALSNAGQFVEPHVITKIEFPDDKNKETIEPDYTPKQTSLSAQAAYLMSDILHDATSINYYMGKSFAGAGYTVYGKTGTSDWGDISSTYPHIPNGSIRDEWMVNYTSDYVIATWEGYKTPDYISTEVLYMNIPGQINRKMLDLMASKEKPTAIAKPDGISTISHVKGKYPYASPNADTPSDMVITGMIKSDSAKLESITADDLESLSSFSANLSSDSSNAVDLNFAAYPKAEKTETPSHSKSFNVLGINYTGNVFYDPGFVFGRVIYKADVKVNGNTVQTITTSETTSQQLLTGVSPGDKVEVCGYYGYEYDSKRSNEICTSVSMPAEKVDTSALKSKISEAMTYVDPTKYQKDYVDVLQSTIDSANRLLQSEKPTQSAINQQIAALQAAIDACKKHPVNGGGDDIPPPPETD